MSTLAEYDGFLASKALRFTGCGFTPSWGSPPPWLFDWQAVLTGWAALKGRAALFTATGTGKTRCGLAWSDQVAGRTGGRVLAVAPLAVAQQTVEEAARVGLSVRYVKDQSEAKSPLSITNYHRLHLFDPSAFSAVWLDESGILKSFSGATKKQLIAMFAGTPYRLATTATPAPNDLEELCNHAHFLGIMTPAEMRSTFFIASDRMDTTGAYRLKRNAEEAFYRWLASWAVALRKPSDLGFPDGGFDLPQPIFKTIEVQSLYVPEGQLFATELRGVTNQARDRRETLQSRVDAVIDLVRGEPDEQWLLWCGLNDEQDAIARALGAECVSIAGRTPLDERVEMERAWRRGDVRCLITKPGLFGWGLNWQHCARMAFVGLGYSFEEWYQAYRRCWRFGQQRTVHVYMVLSKAMHHAFVRVMSKWKSHELLMGGLVHQMADHTQQELFEGTSKGDVYEPQQVVRVPGWLVARPVAADIDAQLRPSLTRRDELWRGYKKDLIEDAPPARSPMDRSEYGPAVAPQESAQ